VLQLTLSVVQKHNRCIFYLSFAKILCSEFFCLYTQIVMYSWDDRMWKLSLTLPSRWFSNHQSKRKRRGRHKKLAPYYDRESEINIRQWLSDQLLLLHLINLYCFVPCPPFEASRRLCTVWTCIVWIIPHFIFCNHNQLNYITVNFLSSFSDFLVNKRCLRFLLSIQFIFIFVYSVCHFK